MKKILIIDDSDIARCMLAEIIANEGYEIIEADGGVTGIELYKTESPDLVTLDITMPAMSGIAVLNELLKIDPKAKVVMISAIGQREVVLNCLKAGAKAYITKPYNSEEVITKIKKQIS